MQKKTGQIIYWAPRILALAFAAFISLFALDVFSEGYGFWQTIVALLMHLIPTALVLIGLAIAWRWEWLGAIEFAALGIGYLIMAWGKFHWTAYAGISGPLFVLAALFLINWMYKSELRLRT
ncbi:MAG: hypothetical protein IPM66_02050 [Acidobacteriota bacterium]|nr:MAG: hypothetical protein IPM66_02050 [Acidobacteriota bacterium]